MVELTGLVGATHGDTNNTTFPASWVVTSSWLDQIRLKMTPINFSRHFTTYSMPIKFLNAYFFEMVLLSTSQTTWVGRKNSFICSSRLHEEIGCTTVKFWRKTCDASKHPGSDFFDTNLWGGGIRQFTKQFFISLNRMFAQNRTLLFFNIYIWHKLIFGMDFSRFEHLHGKIQKMSYCGEGALFWAVHLFWGGGGITAPQICMEKSESGCFDVSQVLRENFTVAHNLPLHATLISLESDEQNTDT